MVIQNRYILNLLAHGETIDEILREYEGLAYEDVLACLMFAVETIENTTFAPLTLEVA